MRFKRGAMHAFDTKEHSTGLHKPSKEQTLLMRAKRGTLRAAGVMSLNSLGLRPADMAASLTKSAKRAKK